MSKTKNNTLIKKISEISIMEFQIRIGMAKKPLKFKETIGFMKEPSKKVLEILFQNHNVLSYNGKNLYSGENMGFNIPMRGLAIYDFNNEQHVESESKKYITLKDLAAFKREEKLALQDINLIKNNIKTSEYHNFFFKGDEKYFQNIEDINLVLEKYVKKNNPKFRKSLAI